MTEQDIRAALPHLANVETFGDPARFFRVTTEEGYWIRTPGMSENVWKTVTMIYPTDDLTAIQIVATEDLPEGAEMCGGTTPEPEIM